MNGDVTKAQCLAYAEAEREGGDADCGAGALAWDPVFRLCVHCDGEGCAVCGHTGEGRGEAEKMA